METLPLFDQNGNTVGWLDDTVIFDIDNNCRAFIEDGEDIFTFNARFIGFFEDGFIWDKKGESVAFLEECGDNGPLIPITEIPPTPPIIPIPPTTPITPIAPILPITSSSWSVLNWEAFLSQ